jgi:cell division protein FtsQ
MSALAARLVLPLWRPLSEVRLTPRLRRRLLAALAAFLFLTCVYLFWFRDSGFVRVRNVSVSGLTASDTKALRSALTTAARGTTTLHLDRGRLERIAALYPVVERLELKPDFPHTLRIHVVERRAAAMAISGRSRVPVAADGSLLRGLPVSGALPVVRLPAPPTGKRLTGRAALLAVRVTGAAPPGLLRRLSGVKRESRRGLVVSMRRGPDLILGDTSRLHAKWAAIARVLADPAARGATYIDVRLPERPAAGGLTTDTAGAAGPAAPAAPAPPSGTAPGQASAQAGGTPAPTARAPTATAPTQQAAPPSSAQTAAPQGPAGNTQP